MITVAALLAVVFMGFAHYWGLFWAPPDRMMGDVYRILFVHVPAAWMAMLFYCISFVGSVASIIVRGNDSSASGGLLPPDNPLASTGTARCSLAVMGRKAFWDRLAVCTAEIGVVMTALALALGSIWGKPAWGVWWTWDPRLTTTALMLVMYAGYLTLRQLIDDPERRAKVAAGVGTLIFLNVPIVYLSVKWWRTLHQEPSSPTTMAPEMVTSLRLNALAILAVLIIFLFVRMMLEGRRQRLEERETLTPQRRGGL